MGEMSEARAERESIEVAMHRAAGDAERICGALASAAYVLPAAGDSTVDHRCAEIDKTVQAAQVAAARLGWLQGVSVNEVRR